MAAPALRAVSRLRLQAFLPPRINVTPVRAKNGVSPPAPPAAPVPQEPFDNSKYQNEQHFSYTPFTFVEYDVELAKFRLPQPSSGRPSPRE